MNGWLAGWMDEWMDGLLSSEDHKLSRIESRIESAKNSPTAAYKLGIHVEYVLHRAGVLQ